MQKSKPDSREISNPRRILLLGSPDSPILDLLQDLTSSRPVLAGTEGTIAGTSHSISIKTPYYTAQVPIWIDIVPPNLPPFIPDAEPLPISSATLQSSATPSPASHASRDQNSDISTSTTDEAPDTAAAAAETSPPSPSWSSAYLLPEARQVLSAIGGFIVCFRKASNATEFQSLRDMLHEVKRVRNACARGGLGDERREEYWDGVFMAVGMKRASVTSWSIVEEEKHAVGWGMTGAEEIRLRSGGRRTEAEVWADFCEDFGFEFVDGEVGEREGKRRDENGELSGLPRLMEGLQANDWESNTEDLDLDFDLDLDLDVDMDEVPNGAKDKDKENAAHIHASNQSGFAIEAAELEGEFFGMKRAVYGGGGAGMDDDIGGGAGEEEDEEYGVEKLEALMLRMQAVKDQSFDMPLEEKKRFVARAVNDVMRTF